MDSPKRYLLVNFGGPRDLGEIEEFLIELLTDKEVIRTRLPSWLHRRLFTRVAKKRSAQIAPDYALIGGKSPIFEDTEAIADSVGKILDAEVMTFHRYLPKTHPGFIDQMKRADASSIRVVPLFPQFSYATTGSIAKWFREHLPSEIVGRMQWVKSYPCNLGYIDAFESVLRDAMKEKGIREEECLLLFSAHGLPQAFIDSGDVYAKECAQTFDALKQRFPRALSQLSYQSKFGRGEWMRPYTNEICSTMDSWSQGRKTALVVPLSFTSDHIETLYEIEELYLPLIRNSGIAAHRCPALNRRPEWIQGLARLFQSAEGVPITNLYR